MNSSEMLAPGGIKKALGHKLIGSSFMKRVVCQTILLLPSDLINFVTKNVWFVGSFIDGWAFTLKASELGKGEYLIFLSDELIEAGESDMRYTILHEIGHVILGHRNSIGEIQSKKEVRLQERQADEFARKLIQ
jgi:Zn-dependent protease with chaperone function